MEATNIYFMVNHYVHFPPCRISVCVALRPTVYGFNVSTVDLLLVTTLSEIREARKKTVHFCLSRKLLTVLYRLSWFQKLLLWLSIIEIENKVCLSYMCVYQSNTCIPVFLIYNSYSVNTRCPWCSKEPLSVQGACYIYVRQ